MCVYIGGSHFRERGVHWGVHEKGVHVGVHEKGGSQGVHKKGVHVNPVNPPGYGPVRVSE